MSPHSNSNEQQNNKRSKNNRTLRNVSKKGIISIQEKEKKKYTKNITAKNLQLDNKNILSSSIQVNKRLSASHARSIPKLNENINITELSFEDIERKIFENSKHIAGSSKISIKKVHKYVSVPSSKESIRKKGSSTCNDKSIVIEKSRKTNERFSSACKKGKGILSKYPKLSEDKPREKYNINKEKVVQKTKIHKEKSIHNISHKVKNDNEIHKEKITKSHRKVIKDNEVHREKITKNHRKEREERVNEMIKSNKDKLSNLPNLRKLKEGIYIDKDSKKGSRINNVQSSSKNDEYFGQSCSKLLKSASDVKMNAANELEKILNTQSEKKETIQIELESTNIMWGLTKRKKKSHQDMVEDYLRKRINQGTKIIQENMHKTHILCLIAHGRYINNMLNSMEIMAAALSITNSKMIYPDKRLNISHLELVIKWYRKRITLIDRCDPSELLPLKQLMLARYKERNAYSKQEFTLMFLALLRVLGINGRLVYNLVPISWRIGTNLLLKPKKTNEDNTTNGGRGEKQRLIYSTSKKHVKRETFSSDSDFTNPDEPERNKKKIKTKRIKSTAPQKAAKKHLTYWIEVYTEEEEEWITIDICTGEIYHSSTEFEKKLPAQCGYILAYSSDLTFKDVTKRYVHNWLSCHKKIRLDDDWWQQTISGFRGTFTTRDDEEDKDLEQFLEKQPLPKTLSSYKSHPLYALQRHLLKFEGIYPPDVSPVGFFRGEPVYARECVRLLHGREKWIKEAKTVIVGEEPYKVVTARPKWDKSTCQVIKDRPLELFGEWQVEDYEPPVAANGKVPRNEYGNVELFKMTMLPKGCVYLNVPGVNKLGRKLGIDCAPAITGFDFHGGWTHPIVEGYVVCEEFQDILMDAWRQEQIEVAKREEEKRVRTIYGNWKKLIKGVLLKERMQQKYGHVLKQEAEERKAKKTAVARKPRKKIKLEESDAQTEQLVAAKPKRSTVLKIDMECSAAQAIKKKNAECLKMDLGESSEEELTASEKLEKMRSILNLDFGSSKNPDLSGSEGESDHSPDSLPVLDDIMHKNNHRKRRQSAISEPSLSEGSTSGSEMHFEIEQKKRPNRSRRRVTYQADTDSDAIFTDSGDDKTFEPERK